MNQKRIAHMIEREKYFIESLASKDLSCHGHWDMGYHQGRLSVLEKEDMDENMDEKMREFEEVCKPVIEYLRKYYNPMCKAIISDGFSEIVVSDIGVPNDVQN